MPVPKTGEVWSESTMPFSSNSSKCFTRSLELVSLDSWIFFLSVKIRKGELRAILIWLSCDSRRFSKVSGKSIGTWGESSLKQDGVEFTDTNWVESSLITEIHIFSLFYHLL